MKLKCNVFCKYEFKNLYFYSFSFAGGVFYKSFFEKNNKFEVYKAFRCLVCQGSFSFYPLQLVRYTNVHLSFIQELF